ncbi:phage terminase large subunit [Alteribacter populi]|uniref:phage terminase large subunit n=1 Tax=Alteribacter populi TaxID=2011011 RepID=UPI001FDFBFC4|nr:phage terminase large subunit [Alteribacter populi]
MAWTNGEWLERPARQKRIDEFTALKDELFTLVDDTFGGDVGALPDDLQYDLYETLEELDRLKRIHRAEVDLLYFAYEYFGDDLNPDNDGNWIPRYDDSNPDTITSNAPFFHGEICEIMNDVSHVRRNDKVAVAAPRSHAKSSFLSKAYPIREVVFRLRKYVIIISETPAVSSANMEWISEQLKNNEKLRADFGPLLSPKDQANIKDNSEEFIAWYEDKNGRKRQSALVQAASTGQRLRGRNWNGNRPDLIVCDDLEDANTNAATPEQRKKLREWFASVVVPLGDPKGEKTAILYMGTTVHHEALLMHILYKRSDFRTKLYRAIIDQPVNGGLWESCREIYVNRENANRADEARLFYEENREDMDEGVRVLWQDVQPIYKLMTWKWDNGSKAFNTEYMNNPIDEESMIFNPDTFTYWTKDPSLHTDDFKNNRRFRIGMGVDFAMGKQRGDYQAVTVTAKDEANDIIYVVDSFLDRIPPQKFIDVIVAKVIDWQPDIIAAEAQMAQEFFVDTLKESLQEAGYPAHTRVKKIQQRSRKELRIEAMLPDIESGRIRFSNKHAALLEQFERYGTGAHDDGPDSCEMSYSVIQKPELRVMDKPPGF